MADFNIIKVEGFSQVCVWRGTEMGDQSPKNFEDFIENQFGVRAQFLECVITAPGQGGEGGRSDLMFAIHEEDISKFAVPRLSWGISWIEDVYANGGGALYPDRIAEYKSWSTDSIKDMDDHVFEDEGPEMCVDCGYELVDCRCSFEDGCCGGNCPDCSY
jgi:hypothetical protein